jgi:MFS family permease
MKLRMSSVQEHRRASLPAASEAREETTANSADVATPLPKLLLLPILIILSCEAFMAESLSAYVGYDSHVVLGFFYYPGSEQQISIATLTISIHRYMMVDLGMADDKDKAGCARLVWAVYPNLLLTEPKFSYWAGLLSSSFYMMQFFSSFLWGAMSDRFGRRPVLLIGSAGSIVTSIMYEFYPPLLERAHVQFLDIFAIGLDSPGIILWQ